MNHPEFLPVPQITSLTGADELRRRNARLKAAIVVLAIIAATGWVFFIGAVFGFKIAI